MKLNEFKLERYFARYEFTTRFLLSASDCESLSMSELLRWTDDEIRTLWGNLRLGYTESRGHPLLRREISRLYERCGPDEVMTAVPEEGIFILMNCLLEAGDHAIVTFPAYQSLYEIAASLGCRVTRWRLDPENGWKADLEFLKNHITGDTRLLVVNFPHNPTGYLPDADTFREIVEIARHHGLFLLSDEMYRLLEHGGETLPAACDLYERAVSLSGLSKTFSLPGLRTGWLASWNTTLLEMFSSFKDYTTICGSAPAEILAVTALRARERILKRNMDIIRGNLKTFGDFIDRTGGLFSWTPPRGGPVAFPKLNSDMKIGDFCREVVEKKSLTILPGDVFDFPGNHFRVGLGRKNLPECLDVLAEYLSEMGMTG